MWIETFVENLQSLRYDRMAVAFLLATMRDSEQEALERLEKLEKISQERLTFIRKEKKKNNKIRMEEQVFMRVRDFSRDAIVIIGQVAKVREEINLDDEGDYLLGLS